jgi:hypothetical protein
MRVWPHDHGAVLARNRLDFREVRRKGGHLVRGEQVAVGDLQRNGGWSGYRDEILGGVRCGIPCARDGGCRRRTQDVGQSLVDSCGRGRDLVCWTSIRPFSVQNDVRSSVALRRGVQSAGRTHVSEVREAWVCGICLRRLCEDLRLLRARVRGSCRAQDQGQGDRNQRDGFSRRGDRSPRTFCGVRDSVLR